MVLCDSVNPVERYDGKNVDTMPKLLADGRVPMSTSQLMNYRINEGGRFADWKNLYFDTSDLIAYASKGDGKVKFILTVKKNGKIDEKNGRKSLGLISPSSKLSSGAIELGQEQYNALNGIEVNIKDLGRTGKYLTQDEILGNPVWRILARHPNAVPKEFAEDSNLLKEYTSWVESQTGDNENMAVYVDSLGKSPKLRAWYVYRLDGRSNANGVNNLDDGDGRFVGLAPEAHASRIARPTLEQALSIVNLHLGKVKLGKK
ncbi:MAG: hypothetical protein KKF48_05555 [Nanoarchaeota archaeon]|nr:hypothetical protein [Nanoarchaeota archaeon]